MQFVDICAGQSDAVDEEEAEKEEETLTKTSCQEDGEVNLDDEEGDEDTGVCVGDMDENGNLKDLVANPGTEGDSDARDTKETRNRLRELRREMSDKDDCDMMIESESFINLIEEREKARQEHYARVLPQSIANMFSLAPKGTTPKKIGTFNRSENKKGFENTNTIPIVPMSIGDNNAHNNDNNNNCSATQKQSKTAFPPSSSLSKPPVGQPSISVTTVQISTSPCRLSTSTPAPILPEICVVTPSVMSAPNVVITKLQKPPPSKKTVKSSSGKRAKKPTNPSGKSKTSKGDKPGSQKRLDTFFISKTNVDIKNAEKTPFPTDTFSSSPSSSTDASSRESFLKWATSEMSGESKKKKKKKLSTKDSDIGSNKRKKIDTISTGLISASSYLSSSSSTGPSEDSNVKSVIQTANQDGKECDIVSEQITGIVAVGESVTTIISGPSMQNGTHPPVQSEEEIKSITSCPTTFSERFGFEKNIYPELHGHVPPSVVPETGINNNLEDEIDLTLPPTVPIALLDDSNLNSGLQKDDIILPKAPPPPNLPANGLCEWEIGDAADVDRRGVSKQREHIEVVLDDTIPEFFVPGVPVEDADDDGADAGDSEQVGWAMFPLRIINRSIVKYGNTVKAPRLALPLFLLYIVKKLVFFKLNSVFNKLLNSMGKRFVRAESENLRSMPPLERSSPVASSSSSSLPALNPRKRKKNATRAYDDDGGPETNNDTATTTTTKVARTASESKIYTRPADIQLDEKQQLAIDIVVKGYNLFITGGAGVGKSFLIRMIVGKLRKLGMEQDVNLFLSASTGIAARQLGGVTFHNIFQIGINLKKDDKSINTYVKNIKRNKFLLAKLRAMKKLIVDEISMLNEEEFDTTSLVLQKIRNSNKPFGGVQMIVGQ